MVSSLYEPISHDFAPTIQAGRVPSDCRGAEAGDVDVGCFSGYTGGRSPPYRFGSLNMLKYVNNYNMFFWVWLYDVNNCTHCIYITYHYLFAVPIWNPHIPWRATMYQFLSREFGMIWWYQIQAAGQLVIGSIIANEVSTVPI